MGSSLAQSDMDDPSPVLSWNTGYHSACYVEYRNVSRRSGVFNLLAVRDVLD